MKTSIRNFVIALAIVAVGAGVAAATPASALTADEIQAQIKELLAKVSELTRQLNLLQVGNATPSPVDVVSDVSPKHRICTLLYRNLARGDSGDDVTGLQEFLRAEGYLSAGPTGYYGPITADAVARWQASQGVTAAGTFGPLSRERIKIWCGNWNQERFSANPTRGLAPLIVTFSTWLSGFGPQGIWYAIDFGDGSSERAADCYAPTDYCQRPGQNTHTYSANGTYTATLNKTTNLCGGNPLCLAPSQIEIVGKVQIHVGPQACTKEYKPVCGSKPIVCVTTPCNPIQQTYSNRCMMEADGAMFVHEGQCRDYKNPSDDPRCKAWYDGCNTCGRSYPGGPAVCTLRACASGYQSGAYCSTYFDSTTNRPPVISSFSGPTTLDINQTGTWTIHASDPENGVLSYSVRWGDEYNYSPYATPAAQDAFVQTTTFTHAYAYSGTYTITIVVRDSSGLEARTSSTLQVGSTYPAACTADAWKCSDGTWVVRTGPNCRFVCPGGYTYN